MVTPNKIFDWTLDLGIIFLIVLTPLAFGSVHVWAYSLMELVIFALLMFWCIKSLFSKEIRFDGKLIPVYISFILFIIYVILQTIPLSPETIKALSPKAYELYAIVIPGYLEGSFDRSISVYSYATWASLLRFISYFGVFFLITQEIRDHKRLRKLILALVAVGFFEAIYGLYGYFSHSSFILGYKKIYYTESATGTFVNRNHFAGYLGIALFTALGYLLGRMPGTEGRGYYSFSQRVFDFLNSARAVKGSLFLIAIVTMALGIAFSLSRMGVFSLLTSALLVFLVTVKGMKARHSKLLIIIVTFGLVAALWYGLDPLEERYYRSSDDLFKTRLVVWKATVELIDDYALTGTGLGTYESVFQRYKPEDFQGRLTVFQHAHNDYLEMLSEIGIIGFVIVLAGGTYFLLSILNSFTKRRDPMVKGTVLGIWGSISFIAVHSLTDFNMHIPSNAFALFAVMAIAHSTVTTRSEKNINVSS